MFDDYNQGGNRKAGYAPYRNNNNYNRGNYNQATYAPQYAPQPKKKSGCKTKMGKNGKMVTFGWMARKGAMYSFLCGETKFSTENRSKLNRDWISGIAITVTVRRGNGMKSLIPNKGHVSGIWWGIKDKQTGKVICKELGLVLNPQGGVGGVVARIGGKPRR